MTVSSKLQALYAAIPTFSCKPGCSDCCGPVPFAKDEWKAVQIKRIGNANCTSCAYSENGGCAIYEDRPFLCRLFGATTDAKMACPHGCKPDKPLSAKQAAVLTKRYEKIMGDTPAGWTVNLSQLEVLGTATSPMQAAPARPIIFFPQPRKTHV